MNVLTNVDLWQNVAIIATLILTLVAYARERRESRRAVYQQLNTDYLSFLGFCMEHRELGLTEFSKEELTKFEAAGGSRDLLDACNMLCALWESAFSARAYMSRGEWQGWADWMRGYLERDERVRKGVLLSLDWYSPRFVSFIRGIERESHAW